MTMNFIDDSQWPSTMPFFTFVYTVPSSKEPRVANIVPLFSQIDKKHGCKLKGPNLQNGWYMGWAGWSEMVAWISHKTRGLACFFCALLLPVFWFSKQRQITKSTSWCRVCVCVCVCVEKTTSAHVWEWNRVALSNPLYCTSAICNRKGKPQPISKVLSSYTVQYVQAVYCAVEDVISPLPSL